MLLLEEHLRRERERTESRQRELDEAAGLLAEVTSRTLGALDMRVEPLAGSVSPAVVNHLLRESRGMVRNFVLTVDRGPALDESTVRANRERIERGDTQRAIYPADVLTTLAGQRWLGVWAEAGEDQRLLPATATEFAVFGRARSSRSAAGTTRTRGTSCCATPSWCASTRTTSTSRGATPRRCRGAGPPGATTTPGSSSCSGSASRTRPSPAISG